VQGVSQVPDWEGRFLETPRVGAEAQRVSLILSFWRFDTSNTCPKQSRQEVKWGGVGARVVDFGEALFDG